MNELVETKRKLLNQIIENAHQKLKDFKENVSNFQIKFESN
jgi:hypothetical protein